MSSNETLPGLVIADSFPVMQWALQRYLSEECGRQVLAVVGDSDSLVERLADLPPESILITELGLPGQRSRDGIHLVEWLTRHCPQMKVMVYSVFSAPLLAKAVLRSGASAYISKRSPLETLKAALECMALGQTFLDPGLHPQRHTGKPLSPPRWTSSGAWRVATRSARSPSGPCAACRPSAPTRRTRWSR